jgi:hypothetical protein
MRLAVLLHVVHGLGLVAAFRVAHINIILCGEAIKAILLLASVGFFELVRALFFRLLRLLHWLDRMLQVALRCGLIDLGLLALRLGIR